MNNSIKRKVKELMKEYPQCRDNDRLLCYRYYIEHLYKRDGSMLASIQDCFLKTPFESITRFRRMIEEKNPELRGDTYEERQRKQKIVRSEIASSK